MNNEEDVTSTPVGTHHGASAESSPERGGNGRTMVRPYRGQCFFSPATDATDTFINFSDFIK